MRQTFVRTNAVCCFDGLVASFREHLHTIEYQACCLQNAFYFVALSLTSSKV